jgi:hypothetical protein
MMTVDQIVAAQKANVETLFGLTNKAFAGVEKLMELNIHASKAALSEASDNAKAALSVKDAQELLALQAGLWPRRPLLTAATCTTSPPAPVLSSARLLKPKPLKAKRSSCLCSTAHPKTHLLALSRLWP